MSIHSLKHARLHKVVTKIAATAGGDLLAAEARARFMIANDPVLDRELDEAWRLAFLEELAGKVMEERPDLTDNLEALAEEVRRRLPDELQRRFPKK